MAKKVWTFIIVLSLLTGLKAQVFNGVFVGIDDYENNSYDMDYCAWDAEEMRNILVNSYYWSIDSTHLIQNSYASRSYILDKIENVSKTTVDNDIFYFSGHGTPSGFMCYEGSYIYSDNDLESYIGTSYSSYACFIDACHSGYFPFYMDNNGVICSSCGAGESSYTDSTSGHSVYTKYLLQGLDNNIHYAEDLHNYAKPLTTAQRSSMTPKMRDNYDGKLLIGYTLKDTLLNDEAWYRSLTLKGNVVVPGTTMLTIKNDVDINLSTYSITTFGGTIALDSNVAITPYICLKNGNTIKGLYSTFSSAVSAASSGETIEVESSVALTQNTVIPSGVTININFNGALRLNSNTLQGDVNNNGRLIPSFCVTKTSNDYYYPSLATAISATNDPSYKLTINDTCLLSSDVTISDCSFEIGPKAKIDLNGNNLIIDWVNNATLTGIDDDAQINPDIRLKSGTYTNGFYSNVSSAFTAGSTIEVRDTLIASSDLTVPAGKTLKTISNCVMKIPYGNNLDVYGTLNAYGTYFTGSSTTWNGIEFKQGSGGTIINCEFDNAALGININYASPTIHDVLIHDCGYGIRIYGSSSNPNIYDNIIWDCNYGLYVRSTSGSVHDNGVYDCSVYGLYLYNTSSDVYDNEIENSRVYMNSCYSTLTNNYIHGTTSSGYAMYIYNSDPYFFNNTITAEDDYTIQTSNSYVCFGLDGYNGPPDCYGLNVLDNDESNDGVINATNGSEVILGGYDVGLYDCGHNSIYNRNYPLWTDVSSTIWAWGCYWGDDDAPDCVGDVEIGDELYEDPDDVGSSLAKSIQSSGGGYKITSTEDSLYHCARELIVEGNHSLALAVLEEIITGYQESNFAYRALNLSLKLCDKYEVADVEGWLAKLSVDNDDLSEIIDLKVSVNFLL